MKVSNCQHFTKMHPNIKKGGCSSSQVKTVGMARKDPEECVKNGRFIGEQECQKVMETKSFFQKIISWFRGLFK